MIEHSHFCVDSGKYTFKEISALLVFLPGFWLHERQIRTMISLCNDAYKQLFGSCDAKPVAPYEYYYPKPENVPPGQTGDGPKPEPEAQQNQIYIAGYEKTSRGVNMAFVTADGIFKEPFYPKSYAVKKLGDCTALVRIDKKILDLTCMPDSMAYPVADADNSRG